MTISTGHQALTLCQDQYNFVIRIHHLEMKFCVYQLNHLIDRLIKMNQKSSIFVKYYLNDQSNDLVDIHKISFPNDVFESQNYIGLDKE
jgi:hypothetical protein